MNRQKDAKCQNLIKESLNICQTKNSFFFNTDILKISSKILFQKLCFKIAQKCLKSSPKKHNTKNNSPICNGRQDSQVRKKTQQLVTDIALSCLLRPEGYIIIYYRILYYIILYYIYIYVIQKYPQNPTVALTLADALHGDSYDSALAERAAWLEPGKYGH